MPETIIDSMYKDFKYLLEFLDRSKEISLMSTVDATFKKTLALSAASYFEHEIRNILIKFVDKKSNSNSLLNNFVKNKAITRQYHTFFEWRANNANKFFALFGEEFKKSAIAEIKADTELSEAIKDFLEIGNTRNELAHLNFANFDLDKTAKEVYIKFQRARKFITFIDRKLDEFNKNSEQNAPAHPGD